MSPKRVFDVSVAGDVLVVAPRRNISSLADEGVQANWQELVAQAESGQVRHVVFDFERVGYFGSTMLEAMLVLWKRIVDSGGRMAVCNASPTVRDILRISRFDTLWPVCDTLAAALETVGSEKSS
jgi:stage II sporulation protein AA (anti-sigma F factor antagonist)